MESNAKPGRSTLRSALQLHSLPFFLTQLVAVVGIVVSGWSWQGLALAVGLYYARMFFVTTGYHRYFSHRAFRTSRVYQFVMALGGLTAAQKGPLWWAARHRHHHRHSDQPGDIHSPVQDGFWWSHMGWFLGDELRPEDLKKIPDFAKYPELVWLDHHYWVGPVGFAVSLFLIGGWHALLWGFFVSTTLLWHGTFTINSLSHVFGSRRYETTDDSRNNGLLALITMGEGWHNNHHKWPGSANQGFRWWEYDISDWILRLLALPRIVWDLKRPPARVLAEGLKPTAPVPAPAAS